MPKENFIEINNIKLCYLDAGNSQIPIILIHGFPFCKEIWAHQIDFLKLKYRVIAYDIRGFGNSSTENEKELNMDLMADDLMLFMDTLHIEKVIVCGFSMGGYILLNALHRSPNRIKAAIFCNTQCISDSEEIKDKRHKTIKEIEEKGLEEFTKTFLKNIFFSNTYKNNPKLVQFIKDIILSTSPMAIIAALKALANRPEMCGSLAHITIPTLIICGENDMLTKVDQSIFLHKNIKDSSLFIVNKAGHMCPFEEADEVNIILDNFLKNLPEEVSGNLYGSENPYDREVEF